MTYFANRHLFGAVLTTLTLTSGTAFGFSPDRYAESSRMASGRWAKVRVNETGMQLITTAQLRNLGFSDPAKVHVYGYGGRMISETLDDSHHDDLPLLPSIKTSKGIVFYGTDRTSWKESGNSLHRYSREQNPYSLYSYYFISDCEVEDGAMPVYAQGQSSDAPATTFTAHLIHEQELQSPYVSGRRVYGEDFRTQTAQSFPFTLTGRVGDDIKVYTVFGANLNGKNVKGSISVTADGQTDSYNPQTEINGISSTDVMFKEVSSVNNFKIVGDKVSIGVKLNPAGVVKLARLDYIFVEYERALSLAGGADLHFYDVAKQPKNYTVSGCSASTQIWDVTDPGRPMRIEAKADGDKLSFTSSIKGYREYVAFDAEKVNRAITPSGSVATQNIHGMAVPDMLIISPAQYIEQARRIAAIHEDLDNWRVHILTPEALYNEFSSGTPEVSAFRKALKMWYDRGEEDGHRLSHCLIISRPTYDNLGVSQGVKGLSYPRVPMWQDYYDQYYNKEYSFGMDDYIAMLEDGASTTTTYGLNTTPISIAVGRMPVKSVSELTTMVDKLERYVRTPQYGSWRSRGVILADDRDRGAHMKDAEDLYQATAKNSSGLNYERIFIDTYDIEAGGRGFEYPAAKKRLMQLLNDGVATWSYIGHGSPNGLTGENMFNWSDVNSMTNKHPFIMYAPTCEFLRWDDDNLSGAEILWLYPEGGSVAMMIASRSVLINANGELTKSLCNYWCEVEPDGRGITIGDMLRKAKNGVRKSGDNNCLRFAVMGDPALRMPTPLYNVVIDEINGHKIAEGEEFPVFGTNDKLEIKGHIEDQTGALASDFNGEVEIQLYDAERVVKAHGNGDDDDAAKMSFNMRTSQLNQMREYVKDGMWTSTMLIPSIIDNNYSPARLSMYAYDGKGMEGHGACEQFYVYGEGTQVLADNTPPTIELLALNSESFSPGDIVNESPVVLARFRDDTGINVFGGIIGHELTLKVDDKTYTGVTDYYTPALGDSGAGSIVFPLESVEPGDHELTFTVYDVAGNFAVETIPFRVAVGRAPEITDVYTDVNPATTSVKITLNHDRPSEVLDCLFEVFDLSGRKVWSKSVNSGKGVDATAQVTWNLCNTAGMRVPRGIYLYRATVTTSEGSSTSQTRKLAVTAR